MEKTDNSVSNWDGQWTRTIVVPKGVQGRCIDEVLRIDRKQWYLHTVVHSTYECNQAFLELAYEGVINEVKIKKKTDDRDLRFQVSGIHLVELVDVAGDDRAVLKGAAVEALSDKYVPLENKFFEQKSILSKDGMSLQAQIFPPILDLAIPNYPNKSQKLKYTKQQL